MPSTALNNEEVAQALKRQLRLNAESEGANGVLADMALPESLPIGWASHFDEHTKHIIYTDVRTGDQRNTHPLLDYYMGVLFMEAGGGNAAMKSIESSTPPGDKEIADMCEYLRIGSGEDPYVREVAVMALSAPLPPGWEESEDEMGNPIFKNTATGVVQPSHPLDVYFNELIARRRAEVDIGRTSVLGDPAPSPPAVLAAAYSADTASIGTRPSRRIASSSRPITSQSREAPTTMGSDYSDDLEYGSDDGEYGRSVQHQGGEEEEDTGSVVDLDAGEQQKRMRRGAGVREEGPGTATQPLREHIRVAVRARPLLNLQKDVSAWLINSNGNTLQIREQIASSLSNKAAVAQGRVFRFDSVEGPDTTNEALTSNHVYPLLNAAFKGINCTVCAYGQTGSGKTHTMFGPKDVRGGVVGLSLAYLYGKVEEAAVLASKPESRSSGYNRDGQIDGQGGVTQYKVIVSMLELYNEQLQDLLASPQQQQQQNLTLMDDPQVGIRVHGLTEVECPSYAHALSAIETGCSARSIGATQLNERSSRAHTIVRVQLEGWGGTPPSGTSGHNNTQHSQQLFQQQKGGGAELRSTSLLHFVDLAGSERLARTGSSGIRFTEGTSINLSLLMLGSVVAKLADGRRPDQFIPYRNSKLTRLLQPCLGGNARTAILATINPSQQHVEETLNTLQFAQRTMNVVNTVTQNRFAAAPKGSTREQEALIASLKNQVSQLQGQLAKAKAGSSPLGSLSEQQLQDLESRLDQLESTKTVLLDRLEEITGQPQGGVYDLKPPPTPPDLHLPGPRPPGKAGRNNQQTVTADAALKSIARVAQTGRPTGTSGALRLAALAAAKGPAQLEGADPPEAVVMSVRRVRAERDELRRRDAKLRKQLNDARVTLKSLEPYLQQQSTIEDCVSMLDDLIGPAPQAQNPGAKGKGTQIDIIDRLREGVESVVLLSAELSSVQRQLHSSIALQQAAEQRATEMEALWHNSSRRTGFSSTYEGEDGSDAEGHHKGELQKSVQELQQYSESLRKELSVTKAELTKWRNFTEQPTSSAQGEGDPSASVDWAQGSVPVDRQSGGEGASGQTGGAVVVGSMAIRAAREARARAGALEQELRQAQQQCIQLQGKIADLEAQAAASKAQTASKQGQLPPRQQGSPQKGAKGGVSGKSRPQQSEGDQSRKESEAGEGPETTAQQQEQFERAKARVVSLAREVAALTRERDALLGIVLDAAQHARASANSGDGVPLIMPTSLAQRLLAGGELSSSSIESIVSAPHSESRSSLSSSRSGAQGALSLYAPHPPRHRPNGNARGGLSFKGQRNAQNKRHAEQKAAAYNIKQVLAGNSPDGGLPPRPSFDASPPSLEARIKFQKVEERAALRGEQLPPLAGADQSMKDAMAAVPVTAGGADMVGLKQRLVQAEKARRQAELQSAHKVKEAEHQVAAVKKQSAQQAAAAADQMARTEEAHAAELGRIKSDATGAITTLMQENSRLRQMLEQDRVLNSKLVQSAAGGKLQD